MHTIWRANKVSKSGCTSFGMSDTESEELSRYLPASSVIDPASLAAAAAAHEEKIAAEEAARKLAAEERTARDANRYQRDAAENLERGGMGASAAAIRSAAAAVAARAPAPLVSADAPFSMAMRLSTREYLAGAARAPASGRLYVVKEGQSLHSALVSPPQCWLAYEGDVRGYRATQSVADDKPRAKLLLGGNAGSASRAALHRLLAASGRPSMSMPSSIAATVVPPAACISHLHLAYSVDRMSRNTPVLNNATSSTMEARVERTARIYEESYVPAARSGTSAREASGGGWRAAFAAAAAAASTMPAACASELDDPASAGEMPSARGAPINIVPCLLQGSSILADAFVASGSLPPCAPELARHEPALAWAGFGRRLASLLGLDRQPVVPAMLLQGVDVVATGSASAACTERAETAASLVPTAKRQRVTTAEDDYDSGGEAVDSDAQTAVPATPPMTAEAATFDACTAAADALLADPVLTLAVTIGCGYGYGLHTAQLARDTFEHAPPAPTTDVGAAHASGVPDSAFSGMSAAYWDVVRPALGYPVDAALSRGVGPPALGASAAQCDGGQGVASAGSAALLLSLSHRMEVATGYAGACTLSTRWISAAAAASVAQTRAVRLRRADIDEVAGSPPLVPASAFLAAVHDILTEAPLPAVSASAPEWVSDAVALRHALRHRVAAAAGLRYAADVLASNYAAHAVTLAPPPTWLHPAAASVDTDSGDDASTRGAGSGGGGPAYLLPSAALEDVATACLRLLADPVVRGVIPGAAQAVSAAAPVPAGADAASPATTSAPATAAMPLHPLRSGFTSLTGMPPRDLSAQLCRLLIDGAARAGGPRGADEAELLLETLALLHATSDGATAPLLRLLQTVCDVLGWRSFAAKVMHEPTTSPVARNNAASEAHASCAERDADVGHGRISALPFIAHDVASVGGAFSAACQRAQAQAEPLPAWATTVAARAVAALLAPLRGGTAALPSCHVDARAALHAAVRPALSAAAADDSAGCSSDSDRNPFSALTALGVLETIVNAVTRCASGTDFPRLCAYPVAVAAGASTVVAACVAAGSGASSQGLAAAELPTHAALSAVCWHNARNGPSGAPAAALTLAVALAAVSAAHGVLLRSPQEQPPPPALLARSLGGASWKAVRAAWPHVPLEAASPAVRLGAIVHALAAEGRLIVARGDAAGVAGGAVAAQHSSDVAAITSAAKFDDDTLQRCLLESAEQVRMAERTAALYAAMATFLRLALAAVAAQAAPLPPRPPAMPQFILRQLHGGEAAVRDVARSRNDSWLLTSCGEGSLIGSLPAPLLLPAPLPPASAPGARARAPARLSLSVAGLAACHPYPRPAEVWAAPPAPLNETGGGSPAALVKALKADVLAMLPTTYVAGQAPAHLDVLRRTAEDMCTLLATFMPKAGAGDA